MAASERSSPCESRKPPPSLWFACCMCCSFSIHRFCPRLSRHNGATRAGGGIIRVVFLLQWKSTSVKWGGHLHLVSVSGTLDVGEVSAMYCCRRRR
uniref:Uncharacterized protein n=1 Tax=Leishmania guyanensis TaxID=5670 RepID=A0A1E1IWU0_LEIGU|nr:Hypothetical protein BN36_2332630 [Leishmania guyanensis]